MDLKLDDTVADVPEPGDTLAAIARRILPGKTGPGRYVLLERIAADELGVVYAAFDPDLDRKVTLELVCPPADGGDSLLREAQILAGLAHPNVITVHDVGGDGEYVWIAGEFVAGRTLAAWASERPRRWLELLGPLRDAARGIAAAHAVGLVHRAVAADRVKIDGDGRVRITDFDLARGRLGDRVRARPDAREPGAAADQRAWSAMATTLLAGARDGAPRWLRRVVARGLAEDPAQRWPTMTALVDALDRGRGRARRVVIGVVALAVVALALVVVAARRLAHAGRVAACERAGAEIDAVWSDAARTRLRAAFVATGAAEADTAVAKLTPWFDRHAEGWRAARVAVCRHVEVERDWPEELAGRGSWCLDDRRMAFAALVDELAAADAAAVYRAVSSAAALADADRCIDPAWLLRQPAPPTAEREQIAAAHAEVLRVDSLRRAGRYEEALAAAAAARTRVEALAWPPLIAAVRLAEGLTLGRSGAAPRAEEALVAAYALAVGAGAWSLAGDAATALVFTVGHEQARPAEGRDWFRHAEVAGTHAGDKAGLIEAARLVALSAVLDLAGEFAEASALLRRSLAIQERVLGPDHPDVGLGLNNLGSLLYATGDDLGARGLLTRAVELRTRALGREHPDVAQSLGNLAAAYVGLGDLATARSMHEQALAIKERTLAPDHPSIANSLNNLALVHYHAGALAEARPLHERALAIRERALGVDDIAVADSLANLAAVDRRLGDVAAARAAHERALAIYERTFGPDHVEVGRSLVTLAPMIDDPAASDRMFARGITILERVFGPDHRQVADAQHNLGFAALERGEPGRARVAFERALAIDARIGLDADVAALRSGLAAALLAEGRVHEALAVVEQALAGFAALPGVHEDEPLAEWTLARALLATGGDRARAVAAAERARDALRARPGSPKLAEVEAFLAAHPR